MSKKILFVSSKGGHYSELMKLTKTMQAYDSIIVTEWPSIDVKADYYLKSGSRKQVFRYLLVAIMNFYQSFKIITKEKPDIIISTGAHSCFSFFVLAKVLKKQSIYIESFAKVTSFSLTYKLVKKLATCVIVQHEGLKSNDSISYFGGVY